MSFSRLFPCVSLLVALSAVATAVDAALVTERPPSQRKMTHLQKIATGHDYVIQSSVNQVFLVKNIKCGPAGAKLGYRSGIFKDFVSEKTRVSLSCRSSAIIVNLNFSDPFRGLVHAGKKDSGCSFRGNGQLSYSLNVPHTSCGTTHVTPQDSFANTLTIRYHPALELEGDEIKTILCKYGTGSIQLG